MEEQGSTLPGTGPNNPSGAGEIESLQAGGRAKY
jgi:hypothetical protein